MAFSYKWITEDTRPHYEQLLQLDAERFRKFRHSTPTRTQLPLEKAYNVWWMLKARTGYKTSDDMLRYKQELFAVCAAAASATT